MLSKIVLNIFVWQWSTFNIMIWVFILKMVIVSFHFGVEKQKLLSKVSLQKSPKNPTLFKALSFAFHLESNKLY